MISVTLKDFGQRPIGGASILVDRTRLKQLFHTSQNRPFFCAFYWVTTFSSANRVSGWPRGWNIGGVSGELRRLGLTPETYDRFRDSVCQKVTIGKFGKFSTYKTLVQYKIFARFRWFAHTKRDVAIAGCASCGKPLDTGRCSFSWIGRCSLD